MDRWDNSSKASEWKDLISKVWCKVCSQSHMTAINGTGCRVLISAGKSCLSGVACLPKCQYTLTPKSWQTKTSCCHTRDMVGKSAWWKVTEKQRREEKNFASSILGCFHPVVALRFWQSSFQDGLSCSECSITQARWSRCGLSIWDQTKVELLGSPWVLTHATGSPKCCGAVMLGPLHQQDLFGSTEMAGLVPLTTSLPSATSQKFPFIEFGAVT